MLGGVKGDAMRGNLGAVSNVLFSDFVSRNNDLNCKKSSVAIKTLNSGSDLIPAHKFSNIRF